jgi:hypothetical protein
MWIPIKSAPDNMLVMTKIDLANGQSSEKILCRRTADVVNDKTTIWFTPDYRYYVCYHPTHWRYLNQTELAEMDIVYRLGSYPSRKNLDAAIFVWNSITQKWKNIIKPQSVQVNPNQQSHGKLLIGIENK